MPVSLHAPREECNVSLTLLTAIALASPAAPPAGSRLAHLDERSPFAVGPGFPRLTTPMWFGEEGVDAVVILSIDDMTLNAERYRAYLEPILRRLKEVEGRSPLSIFTCRIDPADPQLAPWASDGVRLDVHTRSHPCPLLGKGFDAAAQDVLACVSGLAAVPGGPPAAYRMPCCDSINSASPRFFSEILPLRTPDGHFLRADSSVLMFLDASYRAYAPFVSYAATAEGYPYPYVVAGVLWELPIIAPSDWQAQNRRRPFNPQTVADMEAALDGIVEAKGVYTLCFHPHGWIRNDQVVEVIDHAVKRHGRRVRFLNFHDVLERIDRKLLGGVPLRGPDGGDQGVRLLDLDADGALDVVIGNDERRETRVWDPEASRFRVTGFPFRIVTRASGEACPTGVRFGVLQANGFASALVASEEESGLAHFDGERWTLVEPSPLGGLEVGGLPVVTAVEGRDRGVRLRDAGGDGLSELLVSNERQNACFRWDADRRAFAPLPYALPRPASIADAEGRDRGARFHDLDGDGRDDVLLSNDDEYYVYLFEEGRGWSRRVLHGAAGAVGALPRFVSAGRDMGAWIQGGALYCANEDTARLPDLVEVRRLDLLIEHAASRPLEPEEALEAFRVAPGRRVELFAAEPLVRDPVAVDFGPDGRTWVAEMGSYPLGQGPDSGGRVKLLRDRDGDGRADEAVLFADGLSFPAGVLAFGKGVLVPCAPDILYLEDSDGDSRADVRRAVFTGFGEGNQQHRVNGLHFGIDNWIYGANGDSGGTITVPGHSEHPAVGIGGRDFRFAPDLATFEAESGRTQFGLALDDFSNRFGSSNSRHLLHAVMPERYLRRNPHWAPPDPVLDIPEHGAMARIFPVSKELLSLNAIHVPGHFSSACGVAIDRGGRLPEPYRGSAFVCEPVGNVVHRDVLVPDGATFRARRGEEAREVLASTDNWFRPVYGATGPDGALYVVDMYRYVIEHPDYVPRDIQEVLDITAGRDRGRIWRLVPARDGEAPPRHRDLTGDATGDLVRLLEHPNGWWRDAAQRLLVERRDPAAAPLLEELARSAPAPAARAHALGALEGLGALRDEVVAGALADPSPPVREHALRLAEPRFARSPALLAGAALAAADGDLRVRFQAALSLGDAEGPAAAEALARILPRDVEDRWMRAAVLSSSLRHAAHLLAWVFAGRERPPEASGPWRETFEALARTLARKGDLAAIEDMLEALPAEAEVGRWHVLLLAVLNESGRAAAFRGAARVAAHARDVLLDASRPVEERVEAARALGSDLAAPDLAGRVLSPREPAELNLACARALARAGASEPGALDLLVASFPALEPRVRSEALEGLLATPRGAARLVAALEAEEVFARDLDLASRGRLVDAGDEALRGRARKVLEAPAPDREAVVARYRAAVQALPRDAARGREVFRSHCATCHRLEGEGFEVGPDLAAARAKGEAYVIEAVLNPGRMVPPRYVPYAVETSSGVSTGIIASESEAAITLLRAGGVRETILRADVVRLAAGGESLMPVGLEAAVSPEDMAQLLGFLAAAPVPLGSVAPEAAAAARRRVRESGHDGIAEVLEAAGRERQASWMGDVEMHYARQIEGRSVLRWRTRPVPLEATAAGRHVFRFPAAMGYVSQPSGSFTLFLGERRLLELDVSLESRSWKSADGRAVLTYTARAGNSEDTTGEMALEVPVEWLEPGKPAELKVVGSASASRRWLGLLPVD
ncbi:MAG: c-type cytochrome [Planctomycetes bacterium]|nr:c-type cytochrome [Planctomycetota bacterium]